MRIDERLENAMCAEKAAQDCQTAPVTTPASYLRNRAHSMRVEAKQLDELADSLPGKMSSPAEQALWRVLLKNNI